jgi:hypothetical protein
MFSFIRFFRINEKNIVFDKQYRVGYNKLWINSIRNYRP